MKAIEPEDIKASFNNPDFQSEFIKDLANCEFSDIHFNDAQTRLDLKVINATKRSFKITVELLE